MECSAGVPLGELVASNKRRRDDSSVESLVAVVRSDRSDSELLRRFTSIGDRFLILVVTEREKRKISAATGTEFIGIKEEYDRLITKVLEENLLLRGRLAETRVRPVSRPVLPPPPPPTSATVVLKKEAVERKRKKTADKPAKEEKVISTDVEMKDVEEEKKTGGGTSRKSKARAMKAQGKAMVIIAASEKRAADEKEAAGKKEEFTVVKRKNKKIVPEKDRLEKLKAREPEKSFVVAAGEGGSDMARKAIWSEIVKKVSAPQVRGSFVLPRGDLVIKPADGKTYEALKEIERGGLISVREEGPRWPKVLVYDVDRSLDSGSIPGLIADQNPTLGILKAEAGKVIKPIFRRGPKTGQSVWWVCEVAPKVFRSLVGKRIFVGLGLCKVVEFSNETQCFACQGFGHTAAKCKRGKLICGHCSREGHSEKDCPVKKDTPKCVNCGLAFKAGHRGCATRRKVYRTVALRTDFGLAPQ